MQSIRRNFNKCIISTVIFFDVEKVFRQVWHKGLLSKLYGLGLHINLIKWIKSFLQDRWLTVKLNDILSELHGAPQGSPLSPILFILYVTLSHLSYISYLSYIPQPNHKFMFHPNLQEV